MKIDPTCKKCEKKCKQRHPAIVVSCAKFIPAVSLKAMKKPIMQAVTS